MKLLKKEIKGKKDQLHRKKLMSINNNKSNNNNNINTKKFRKNLFNSNHNKTRMPLQIAIFKNY